MSTDPTQSGRDDHMWVFVDSQYRPITMAAFVELATALRGTLRGAAGIATALARRGRAKVRNRWHRLFWRRVVTCDVTYQELAAFASGEAEALRRGQLSDHLSTCNRCRERLALLSRADALLRTMPPVPPPAETVQTAALWVGIARLPDRQRQAIHHCAFDKMSYEEIAHALGVPVEKAVSLVHRARANLAQALVSLHAFSQTDPTEEKDTSAAPVWSTLQVPLR